MTVDDQVAARATTAVRVLAELTPAAARRDDAMKVPLDWFRWLNGGLELFSFPDLGGPPALRGQAPELPTFGLDRVFGERLAAVQQVRGWNSSVRIGWLWLAGTAAVVGPDGEETRRKVFRPLVTRPVRVAKSLLRWQLEINGDPEISTLVADSARARELEERIEYGGGAIRSFSELTPTLLERLTRLKAFARDCTAAAGFGVVPLSISRIQPEDAMRHEGLQLIVGLGIYVVDEPARTARADSLLAWGPGAMRSATAFHAVYAGHATSAAAVAGDLETPLPLSERQVEAVTSSRTNALTVISGAPGTGKSHTLTSIVWDALRHGDSVLVTAKGEGAVDALTDLFEREPGLTPVVFGSAERRTQLAHRLSDGRLRVASPSDVRRAEQALDVAIDRRDHERAAARRTLLAEWLRTDAGAEELAEVTRAAPGAFTAPASSLADLVARCHGEVDGWRGRRRRARDERALRRLVGAPSDAEHALVLQAIEFSTAMRQAEGTTPTDACVALEVAEAEVRRCLRAWLALETRSEARLDRSALAAVSTLATALRSGRSARRAQLARLRDDSLTRALPVWIGTLGDVDDLLPAIPGLFDLVLIDEASSTEQTAAAAALLRGERGVVVGDPRQLRHVSFLADAQITDVFERNGVAPEGRSQLDVRRNSVFDAAAAASPVVVLDEHFRSAPHLIDVVAEAVYDGQLFVATRTPRTQSIDCVSIESVTGTRSKAGVVQAEVDAVLRVLRRLHAGSRSVGVVTPFRAQADALEEAVLQSFTAEQLVHMDLRVSTAHGFQGNERDVVVCSLGLVDDDARGWAFASDPHLLAVMLTRARRSMVVVTSCRPEPASLLGRYLAAADSPPGPPPPAAALSPWAQSIVADLRLAGLAPSEAYPTGRHVVDAAVDVGEAPVAVICELHPDGIDAHIDRHVALHRAGWRTMDALRSDGDAAAMRMVEMINRIRAGS